MLRRAVRLSALFALVALCMAGASARADTGVVARWVQYNAAGAAEVRVVVRDAACPAIVLDGATRAMAERAAPDEKFPVRVCSALLSSDVKHVSVLGEALPVPKPSPSRIIVLGDTGCRIKLVWLQACNDPKAWPFKENAASAASLKPDLVIHVGDYHYRETPCPPLVKGCAGSPYGDNWAVWDADFFSPAAALLATAPWIMVRGNHEDCERAGIGWGHFLAPGRYDPAAPCVAHEPPYAVTAGQERLIVLDTAIAPDTSADKKIIPTYQGDFHAITRLADGPSWLLLHRPLWGIYATEGSRVIGGNLTLAAASGNRLPNAIELQLAGHIHVLEVLNFSTGQPPQIIAGHGGDDLSTLTPLALSGLNVAGAKVSDGFSMKGFGFLLMEKQTEGWRLTMYDQAGKRLSRCTFAKREVRCPAT